MRREVEGNVLESERREQREWPFNEIHLRRNDTQAEERSDVNRSCDAESTTLHFHLDFGLHMKIENEAVVVKDESSFSLALIDQFQVSGLGVQSILFICKVHRLRSGDRTESLHEYSTVRVPPYCNATLAGSPSRSRRRS